eukprot:1178880-Prorocentrum_minimum.AAC.7
MLADRRGSLVRRVWPLAAEDGSVRRARTTTRGHSDWPARNPRSQQCHPHVVTLLHQFKLAVADRVT